MKKDTAILIAQLLLTPAKYVGKKVVARGRLQATAEGVLLAQLDVSIKLDITPNDLLTSDKKAWMFVGGPRLYDYEARVEGVFLCTDENFVISDIDRICLFDFDKTNEMLLRKTSGGQCPVIVEI